MDQTAKDLATAECAEFTKELDEVLTKFGFHSTLVLVVGHGHGAAEHEGFANLAIKGCHECAASALGQSIWELPAAMRSKFLHGWLEKTRSGGVSYQPNNLVH